MQLLKATDLSHSFETLLYEGVDLTCNEGESIAILGVSGSGKSTILNHLSTLLPPKKGEIDLLDKKNIYSLNPDELLALRRYDVGIIFQSHYLFRGFSTQENLAIASFLASTQIDMELLEKMEIVHTLRQNIGELSGGQQQRVSIARILCKKPKMIFADEPTGNLDKATALSVMKIILEFLQNRGAGMVLATHDEEIAKNCTKIYLLENKIFKQIK